jgi:uncharacterized linocin/CFP29 family protein
VNHLFRELAPVTSAAWTEIEAEAKRSLTHFLAARKLVDFTGPVGWDTACLATGRAEPIAPDDDLPGVETCRRHSLPLLELRVPFTLSRAELDRVERGATDVDLGTVVAAARQAAIAEDMLVFRGVPGSSPGVIEATPHDPIPLSDDYTRYPQAVALAVATLKDAGVGGPYALALGPRCYRGVIETTEHGGYPLLEHLRIILGGPVVWAPAVDGAVVLSQRGDDIELVIGQDFAIGYRHHDADTVTLYLEETAAVRVSSPEAAIRLAYL